MASSSKWNLNRALVMLGAFFVLLAVFAFAAWKPAAALTAQNAPLLIGVVVAIVLAFYAPAWMYLVAGVLVAAFPLIIIFVFGAYQGIIHPGSGVEGTGLLFLLLGALLALLGGIAGFVQERRRAHPPVAHATRAWQGVLALVILSVILGLMTSASWANRDYRALAEQPGSHVDTPDATAQLFFSGLAFGPREVTIPVDKLVALHIENRDDVVHTFTYERDGALSTTIIPEHTDTVLYFRFDEPQSIHVFCEPHSQGPADMDPASMWGTLTVA